MLLSDRLIEVRAGLFRHWCPACDTYHDISVSPALSKTTFCVYDRKHDSPTFSPSIRVRVDGRLTCHYFLSEGVLYFCEDANHAMAGTSVELPRLPVSILQTLLDSE